ncbi:hypothetical protein BGX21_007158, partial [Mortierella sp. AD011]
MSPQLTLWCLVEQKSSEFSVDISSEKSVYDLKKIIKAEKPNDLGRIDANDLIFWMVDISIIKNAAYDQDYKRLVDTFKSDHHNKMGNSDKVGDYIKEAEPKKIQVVIELPKQ